MVRFVQLYGNVPLSIPGHHSLMRPDRALQIPRTPAVHLVEPKDRDRTPGSVKGLYIHLGQPQEIVRARVGAQEGIVASPAGQIKRTIVPYSAYRNPARPCPARILAFGMEKVGLSVLIDAQRDHIQRLGIRDAGDSLLCGLNGGQPKMMPEDGVGRLPGDPIDDRLRGFDLGRLTVRLSFQIGQDSLGRSAAVKNAIKKANCSHPLGHWRRTPKDKTHAGNLQVVRLLCELTDQPFPCLWCQTIGNTYQICAFVPRSLQ
jgi:hypothetical protein